MSNCYGQARTNYFKVRDLESLAKVEEFCDLTGNILHKFNESNPLIVMIQGGDEFGSFNLIDPETDEEHCWSEIAGCLDEGEVLVGMAAGHEKLRYVSGRAFALNGDGREIHLALHDIYELALEQFGIRPEPAEYRSHSKAVKS